MEKTTALSSSYFSESYGARKVQVLPKDANLSVGAHGLSKVLTPLIDYLEKRIHENPEAQDFRLALSDAAAPIQLDAIQSSLALRAFSQEARQRVMGEITVPSVSLIPGVWNSAISFSDFFDGAGMALKKLYRVLGSEDKEAMKYMLAHVAASDVQKFFALPCWRGFSRNAVVSPQDMSLQLGDLDVTYRGLSLPGDEGLPKLAFYRFKSRSDLNAEIRLIGRLDLNEKNIFTGFACMARRGNQGIEKSTAFVANKPFDLDGLFDKSYLFEGNRGAVSKWQAARPEESVVWLGVQLTSNGKVQAGSQGDLIHRHMNGTRREWHGMTFDENAKIVDGSNGNQIFMFQDKAHKIVWKNVQFSANGRIKNNQIGTKIERPQNGQLVRWEGVRFTPEGNLRAGCRGDKLVKGNDGKRTEWRGVAFQASGDLQAGTTGKVRLGSADKWKKEWQNVRFNAEGGIQTDDNGVTNGTYTYYLNNGSYNQWKDIKMSSQGKIQDGSDGELCISHKKGKSLLRNYRFNSDFTIKAGSKGAVTNVFSDNSKIHFVGASIARNQQIEENVEMTIIREYPNNKCTLTWHETMRKDGVYSQKGQKGLTCELTSPDGQRQWFHGESMMPHSDFSLDNDTGELVLLSKSQEEVVRLSPLPHQSIGESSRAR